MERRPAFRAARCHLSRIESADSRQLRARIAATGGFENMRTAARAKDISATRLGVIVSPKDRERRAAWVVLNPGGIRSGNEAIGHVALAGERPVADDPAQ